MTVHKAPPKSGAIAPRQPALTSTTSTTTSTPKTTPVLTPPTVATAAVFDKTTTTSPTTATTTPTTTTKKTTPAALVGRTAPMPPSTPRFTLKDAVADVNFLSKDPATLPVPAGLLDVIKSAKRVLLIGHTGPDGDCVGTTLAMQRALRDLGKECDVCVDDVLSGSLRTVDKDHQVKRATDLQGKSWDLALIMDVGGPDRIGGALGLLQQAGTTAVVDHHMVSPEKQHFNLRPEQAFTSWVESDFPCAALQAAAILGHLKPELDAAGHNPAHSMMAALCGFATDTGWGTFQGLDKEKFRFFKHMLVDSAKMGIADVEAALRYDLPPNVAAVLEGQMAPSPEATPAAQALLKTLAELQSQGSGVVSHSWPTPKASSTEKTTEKTPTEKTPTEKTPAEATLAKKGLGLMSVSDAFVEKTLALGHLDDPHLVDMDITNVLKWGAVKDLGKTHTIGAFLIEKDGDIFVSLRGEGQGDLANRLAVSLGGGGHAVAAGARVRGATLEQVKARIFDWCKAEGIV